ncbi:porin [Burkholderia oklahomensis]|uniref:porin n=1 Tax=Burkholderia oklahomensis TaxID=342113 RepID=UPI00016A983E|nr:porin [Burkholderia oklahomensis]AJX34491.1 gram-negative porin family protein [Burkholderia oklahomensis C6786]AOI48127.1 porin [Burkholderia oklahomensis C6786]KUY50004.1 porin [Burkholderia oklahomensis C6786]MBI0363742.1 porin [Burkholderia oklahomensis]SUY27870.1 Outer membrane porin protein BP0840 precursor [Burkholderia oklahomensis]
MNNWKWLASLLSAAAAMPAFAQSSVVLYGRIDTAIEFANMGPRHVTRMGSGNLFASQWGLKGVEDLGGGYSAIFKLENGFNSANGTLGNGGALFGREAWVGVIGPFGGLQAGELYTIVHTTFVTYSLPGYAAGLAWGNASNNFVGPAFLRTHNGLRYTSPRIGDFLLRATASRGASGASGQPSSLGDTYGAGINYARGPLSIDVDYMVQRFSPASAASLSATSPVAAGNYALGAVSYDFAFMKLAFLYMRHRGGPDVPAVVDGASAYPHHDLYELDATIPLGRASLLVSYGHYRKAADSEGNADSYGVRLDYPLSKRTVLYTGAAMVRNGAHATFTINGAAGGGVPVAKPGATASSIVAGVMTSF